MTRQLTTREKIMGLVRANPSISLRALCMEVNVKSTSNIQYHLKRLEEAGLIHWLGKIGGTKKKACEDRSGRRWTQGNVPLPSMSKLKLQSRIDTVVAKAQNNPHLAVSNDADMRVLANGIKVVVRKPALWGSRAHQSL